MNAIIDRIRREPAVVIGIVAAAVLAAVQSLAGNGIIEADVAATIQRALDPSSGWALPIVAGVITRFFVYSPPSVDRIAATAAATGNPIVTEGPP